MSTPSAEHLWNRCLEEIRDEVTTLSYTTWFTPVEAVALEGDDEVARLRLRVPNPFHIEWLESHFSTVLRRTTQQVLGRRTEITYEVDDTFEAASTPYEATAAYAEAAAEARGAAGGAAGTSGVIAAGTAAPFRRPDGSAPGEREPAAPAGGPRRRDWMNGDRAAESRMALPETHLKPDYTFDTFIEGDGNRLARGAALAIAKDPGGTSFNPFLVYGGVGLGKTHIVHAIGNYVFKRQKARRVLYVTSEQFTNQFVRAIQENRVSDFSDFYRQIDLLIVDDVQFFGGKEKTQEEFFHIFNELHQHGKQIVLCADRPPAAISGIEDRLLSRFRWGLTVDIQPPDLETRIAILQHKTESQGVQLNAEVITFVAERITENIRQLEGALIRLVAHARLYGQEIDLEAAQEILGDLVGTTPVHLEVEDIQRTVAQYYALKPELLSARTRKREIVTARHVAMFLSKQYTSHSLSAIGLRFGGRDHSTVIHGCTSVANRLETEPTFEKEMEEIKRKLNAGRL